MNFSSSLANTSFNGLLFNASGPLCITQEDLESIGNSKSAAINIKSITVEPRAGNQEPFWALTHIGGINSVGLPNLGYKAYIQMVPKLKTFTKPIIASVSGLSIEDNETIFKALQDTEIDLIELNTACPNIEGKAMIGYDFEQTRALLTRLKLFNKIPFGLKLPPYLDPILIQEMAEIVKEFEIPFISCCNTAGNALIIDPLTDRSVIKGKDGLGGLSGAALKPIALGNVAMFYRALKDTNTKIIGIGGIESGRDLYDYILAGADMGQVATVMMHEGNGCFERIQTEFCILMKEKNIRKIEDIQGSWDLSI